MPRKPNTQPTTIYDWRCKALCDVLAIERNSARFAGLQSLAEGWGIPVLDDDTQLKLVTRLAQHALAHGRKENNS